MTIKSTLRSAFGSTVLLSLLATITASGSAQGQDVVLDRIRAVVNEGVVLDSDIRAATEFFKQQARSNRQTVPPDDVLAERVLEQLINQEIRRQHAADIGISIDAGNVNRAIENIANSNNMDTLQFRETLEQQNFSYDLFRDNLEQQLLMQRLIEREVQSRIRVSSQEIDDYVDAIKNDVAEQQRYRLQHILLATPPSPTAEQLETATQRAEDVLEQLDSGVDFAELATAVSDGARALQGGDLGWRVLQELPDFLSIALRSMDVGDIEGPLRSNNGLHVIRLLDQQSDDQTKLNETLARHIFLAGDSPAIEQRLSATRQQLQSGASFKELAAQISEDPNSANNSGELPWFSEDQMPPALEEMANSLDINQLSRPFRTQFGWHLLQVLDRRTRDIDDSMLRDQANAALRQSKVEQETERWSRQLRDESFVEIRS